MENLELWECAVKKLRNMGVIYKAWVFAVKPESKVLPSHMELIRGTWLNVRTSPTLLVTIKVVKTSHRSRQLVSLQLLPVWKCSATRLFMKLANSFFIIQLFLLFSGIYCICNWNIFLQNDETWKGNFWINHVLIAYISLVQSSPPSLRWPLKRRCWEKSEQMKKNSSVANEEATIGINQTRLFGISE